MNVSAGLLSPRRVGSRVLSRPAIVPSAIIRRRQAPAPAIQTAPPRRVPKEITLAQKYEADPDSSDEGDTPSLGKLFTFHFSLFSRN